MTLHGLLLAYLGIVGLLIGSYLNVLIYRLPRGISTVLPRSRCPHCQAAIRPWHNIPLFGYLLLRGRCRACRKPIHWRYPLVEALNASLTLLSFWWFGITIPAIVAAGFCSLMLVLAAIDAEHFLLPNRLVIPGLIVGLGFQPWLPWCTLPDALLGIGLGAGVLLVASGGWYLLKGSPGMGMGDVKMLAMIGAFLGWQGVIVTFFLGALVAAVVGMLGWAAGRLGPQSRLPFGSFLAAAAIVALFWGQRTLETYRLWTPVLDAGFR